MSSIILFIANYTFLADITPSTFVFDVKASFAKTRPDRLIEARL